MKIVVYQPRCSYYVGGGETVPLQQIEFFIKGGHHVTLVTTRSNSFTFSDYFSNFLARCNMVNILYLDIDHSLDYIYKIPPGYNRYRRNNESLHIARQALPILLSVEADAYVAHNVMDGLALPVGKNDIIHLHGFPEEMNYAYELTLSYSYKYIAVANLVKEKWLSMSPIKYIDVVYNGIDINKFFYYSKKKKYDLLYVGRLLEVKGVQYLIESLKILRDIYHTNLTLCIVGTGPYAGYLQYLVEKNQLQNLVTFLGYVDDNELIHMYTDAKLSVLPSTSREGVLTTMLESSACGTPVLTSDDSSMTEFVGNEKFGFLSKIGDSSILAEKIYTIFKQEDQLTYLGNRISKHVHNHRSWDQRIKELEMIYQS